MQKREKQTDADDKSFVGKLLIWFTINSEFEGEWI